MQVLFAIAFLIRLSAVFIVQTSYVPDETFQCTEVAHKLVFGNGLLTWEWKEGLRSYLHPLLFALPLQILKTLNLDTVWMVVNIPRIFQALLCFLGDVLLYRLVVKLYGSSQASYALIMQLSSWYLYYVTPRTLVNNLESLLITATLYLWPTRYNDVVTYKSVILAAISVVIRPTLVVFWFVLGLHYVINCPEKIFSSILKAVLIGVPTFLSTVLIDSYFYGRPVLAFFNFLKFNVKSSAVFGAHPWHWYLSQGLPAILGTHMVFIAIAFFKKRDYPKQFMAVVIATILAFSAIAHKEFRFIQHLFPIFMIWAGLGLHWISRHIHRSSMYAIVMLHCAANILVAFYISFFHQRGTIALVSDLPQIVKPNDHVVFLTPCHTTPYHSHIHRDDLHLRFLDCSPDLRGLEDYEHEERRFYKDPVSWWKQYQEQKEFSAPYDEYAVIYQESLAEMHRELSNTGYVMVKQYFHAHFHFMIDEKMGPHLQLYKKSY